jgi:hypothetical protein
MDESPDFPLCRDTRLISIGGGGADEVMPQILSES